MYNPMMDYQRNQLLAQQAMIQNQLNQMPQQQFSPYPQNPQPQFVVRQVGNIEEAKGFPVDIGTTYLFLDTGTGRIYLKRLNTNNGKSDFFLYGVIEDVQTQTDPIVQINDRLTNIERMIGGVYGKSVPGDAGHAEPVTGTHRADAGEVPAAGSAEIPDDTADGERKRRRPA